MRVNPSFVSVMPCMPTLLGPILGVAGLIPLLPRLALLSSGAFAALPLLFSRCGRAGAPPAWPCAIGPHHPPLLLTGDWPRIGLLCTLSPGLTARRLMLAGSQSSSRRRLLTFLEISAAEGRFGSWKCGASGSEGARCGVDEGSPDAGVLAVVGESRRMSSLTPETPDEDRGRWKKKGGCVNCGGGVARMSCPGGQNDAIPRCELRHSLSVPVEFL